MIELIKILPAQWDANECSCKVCPVQHSMEEKSLQPLTRILDCAVQS